MSWAALVFGLLIALALGPFVMELRKPRLGERDRALAPGRFAQLSQGVTHYRWYDDKARGPVVVCVHGLTTPSFVWNDIAAQLDALGYRVLAYDLFGRGYSDRPAAPQTREFFVQQLEELLRHEGIHEDVTLMGYSMGGSIATCFAARNPHVLRRLVLVAPAGMGHSQGAIARFCVGVPVVGDWLFRIVFPFHHRRGAAKLPRQGVPEAIAEAQEAELNRRGYVPAVLSSMRRMLSETLETEHRAIARANIPVLAIWAAADEVIPLGGMGRLTDWNRDALQAQIEGAGHALPMTHPDEVVRNFREMVHR